MSSHPTVICIIPARFASTRLPGKPLLEIKGKPLIMWVYDAAMASGAFDAVVVATDHDGIFETVERLGGKAVMTAATHQRGTDRVFEAAKQIPHDFVVNLQGDEPTVPPELLRNFAAALVRRIDDNSLLTCISNATIENMQSPHVVKVVVNREQEALYFSRSPIPCDVDRVSATFKRHAGIYGFSRKSLERFCSFAPGALEQIEKLEQLRALENGMRIVCMEEDYIGVGIDTPADLQKFRDAVGDRL
jgi:3-deoxy-manno-octulosonate cytidylyltransferase (CMP-KDO synthetase)